MLYKKLLIVGAAVLMMGGNTMPVKAADVSLNHLISNVGVAAVIDEEIDASRYIEYASETKRTDWWGYKELGIAVVESGNLNVREDASQQAAVVGKMSNLAACEIMDEKDGWYHITSGEVEGFVSAEFIATGVHAKVLGMENAYTRAVVKTNGLNVRANASEEAEVVTQVGIGEELEVIAVENGWVQCALNTDTVYVKEEFVEVKDGLSTAVTLAQLRYGKDVSEVRVELCEYALQFVGNPYVWGGTSLTRGADCSGFVLSIYKNYGHNLSHSSRAQINEGTEISYKDAQPGDLLFYGSSRKNINHVAIYIGGGQIVHANDERTGIVVSNAYYRTPVGACRILE